MSCLTPHKYEKKRENRSTVKMADASAALAEQNAASSKLQALIRARRDRKTARKKRASLAFYADRKKEKDLIYSTKNDLQLAIGGDGDIPEAGKLSKR